MAKDSRKNSKYILLYWPESKTVSVVEENDVQMAKHIRNLSVGWEGDLPWKDSSGKTKPYSARVLKTSNDRKALEKCKVSEDGELIGDKELHPQLYSKKRSLNESFKVTKTLRKEGKNKLEKIAASATSISSLLNESSKEDSESTDEELPLNLLQSSKCAQLKDCQTSKAPNEKNKHDQNNEGVKDIRDERTEGDEKNKDDVQEKKEGKTLCRWCRNCNCRKKPTVGQTSPLKGKEVGYAVNDCKVELVKGTGVKISYASLQNIKLHAGSKPRDLIRGLITHLFSESELAKCSARGLKNKPAIPERVRLAILRFVRESLKIETFSEKIFNAVANKACKKARDTLFKSPELIEKEKQKRRAAAAASRLRKKLGQGSLIIPKSNETPAVPATIARAPTPVNNNINDEADSSASEINVDLHVTESTEQLSSTYTSEKVDIANRPETPISHSSEETPVTNKAEETPVTNKAQETPVTNKAQESMIINSKPSNLLTPIHYDYHQAPPPSNWYGTPSTNYWYGPPSSHWYPPPPPNQWQHTADWQYTPDWQHTADWQNANPSADQWQK